MHVKGKIHRDIKPENIFLQADLTVKVGDVGIARCLENLPGMGSKKMTKMTCIGTPGYMAPEVIKGNYDTACDWYSLGAVVYEMCT